MIVVHKNEGETMGELTRRVKQEMADPSVPITFAGRLDPLASGVVVYLEGSEEISRKKFFLEKSKTYEFSVLCGVNTDTGDVLGVCTHVSMPAYPITDGAIGAAVDDVCKQTSFPYPLFSSKTVQGTPLWKVGKANRSESHTLHPSIDGVSIPVRPVHIHALRYIGKSELSTDPLKEEIVRKINCVYGDFDQEQIKETWSTIFSEKVCAHHAWDIVHFEATVSSGTYIRSIAEYIGKKLCGAGLAYKIHRRAIHDL